MLQNTKSGLAVMSRGVEVLSNYAVYEYNRDLNARSKYSSRLNTQDPILGPRK